jgi:hypothetical protein
VTGSRKDIDAHFDELVDRVVRASVSGEHFLVVMLWLYAARRAYETGSFEQLAKLFRSGVPHSRQIDQMLAALFDSSKLMKGKRKLFESAAARYDLAERDVRRLMSGELKLLGELSDKQLVWQDLGHSVRTSTRLRLAFDGRYRLPIAAPNVASNSNANRRQPTCPSSRIPTSNG